MLHINATKDVFSEYSKSFPEDHSEKKPKDGAKSNPSEEDWVDVKNPDSHLYDIKDKSSPLKSGTDPGESTQVMLMNYLYPYWLVSDWCLFI